MLPRTGDTVLLTRTASVQFSTPMLFRVIRVHDWQTYHGWVWLDGYQLDAAGAAVERRSVFVQVNGLQPGAPTRLPAGRVQARPAGITDRERKVR
ncbi:hypothetical protein [Dactylosporangium matsuzakiense]|uniref:Uncharacterized protein n=1 Tax=Dactylosporangium matsuzakiense TaxID=53360 RepID=A0A9W6KVC0_9ACTN|nr:hypothetical protein [Dactylosporangium matsuzakiense]GLL07221.1 hypothetical protein GCM10017581_089730 [Dactylosporangium matsuzakiense]